jgi:Protein of unknown function (DUF3176)
VRGWWAWELISAIVCVVATVALIVPLARTDGSQQQSWEIGRTQLSLNALVAVISTVIRASLLLIVAGALNQSVWNWFATPLRRRHHEEGRQLKDLETFGEAAANSWNSVKLLYRTRGR